jgi:nicotinate phosphoribosyltransferase
VLSDGMNVDSIEASVRHLHGRARISVGWGTDLTNDFGGCMPHGQDDDIRALQLVCKVTEANGRAAVKLSDNPAKASGPPELVARYRRVFG